MTKDELAAQLRQSFDAWNAHDAEQTAHFYAGDATVRDSPDAENPARGHDAIAARAQSILDGFSDAKLEIVSMCIDDNRACVEWRFTGTHDGTFLGVPASGQSIVNIGASVDQFDGDGKVVSETIYWDAASFLRDVGALPAPASAAAAS